MTTTIKLDVDGTETDDELRQMVSSPPFDNLNGLYTTSICRKCGVYRTSPEGDCKTAKIIDQCKNCFQE